MACHHSTCHHSGSSSITADTEGPENLSSIKDGSWARFSVDAAFSSLPAAFGSTGRSSYFSQALRILKNIFLQTIYSFNCSRLTYAGRTLLSMRLTCVAVVELVVLPPSSHPLTSKYFSLQRGSMKVAVINRATAFS